MLEPPGHAPVSAAPPRLVATDLDGTLLLPDGTISARTASVLAAVQTLGVEVLVVTARPPRWLAPVAALGHAAAICLNGAVVVDLATSHAIERHLMDPQLARAVVADLRRVLPGPVFAVETPEGMLAERGFEGWQAGSGGVARIEDVVQTGVGKLLVRCAGVDDDAFGAIVRDVVAGRGHVHDSGAAGLAEIAARGVTKASTLARWAARRGIRADEVWAFGDMPNDLEMLAWAGRGVAVANAHPRVLAAADEVCGSHRDDGVARCLEVLLS